MNATPAAPNGEPQLRLNMLQQPDGTTKLYFIVVPAGQLVGEVSIRAASPELLPMIAANVLNWANQQRGSGLTLAGADTLGKLDQARKAVNGDH